MLTYDELIEQGTNYNLGDGVSISRRPDGLWFPYFNGTEVRFRAFGGTPRGFLTAKAVMTWLHNSPGIIKRARFNDAAGTMGRVVEGATR